MKKCTGIYRIILILGAVIVWSPMHAELLIMKQTENGFVPLDDADSENKVKIEQILLKYQWPTSAAFALYPLNERKKILAETGDLFTADKPNAEEIWIEKKIQQETGNESYRVVFVPTTIYELFVIKTLIDMRSPERRNMSNPLKSAMQTEGDEPPMDFRPFLQEDASTIHAKMKNEYQKHNEFFMGIKDSAYDYINRLLANRLLEQYPELKSKATSLDFSNALKEKIADLANVLVGQMLERRGLAGGSSNVAIFMQKSGRILALENQNKIIGHFLTLEYEARNVNKAFIVRGSTITSASIGDKDVKLAGSSIWATGAANIEKKYKEGAIYPYSISFGNSLFAGSMQDRDACAYNYLGGEYGNVQAQFKTTGYAVLIDKNSYIKDQCGQLFYISALAPLNALFGAGEWFHSRTKAAIASKDDRKMGVGGVYGEFPADPTGVLLITRDPLKHAYLLSQCIADNGRLLQLGDEAQLTPAEKEFSKAVLTGQKEAAQYYKGVKGMRPIWETVLPRARKNIADRKAATQPQEQTKVGE